MPTEPQTLEDLDKPLSIMIPMIDGVKKFMEGRKAMAPAGGEGGGK